MDIERYVRMLAQSLTYVRSIDGFLVKLGSIAYEIESACKSVSCDPHEVFREMLFSDQLIEMLKPFSCYKDEVASVITSDPRHKVLRSYLDLIVARLEKLECIQEKAIETLTPPSTWFKEHYARSTEKPVQEPHKKPPHVGILLNGYIVERTVKVMLIISSLLLLLTLVLRLLTSVR